MGWWPSRICVILNLVIMLGYGMIDCVVRLSMFALCLSAPSAWVPAGADLYVDFNQKTSKKLTLLLDMVWRYVCAPLNRVLGAYLSDLAETLGYITCLCLGIGLVTGLKNRADWAAADQIGLGALLVAGCLASTDWVLLGISVQRYKTPYANGKLYC